MGGMTFFLKGVKNKNLCSYQFFVRGCRDLIGVCDITEIANSETEDGHSQMEHRKRSNGNSVDFERTIVNFIKRDLRGTWIFHLLESIIELGLYLSQSLFHAIYGHIFLLQIIESPHIV